LKYVGLANADRVEQTRQQEALDQVYGGTMAQLPAVPRETVAFQNRSNMVVDLARIGGGEEESDENMDVGDLEPWSGRREAEWLEQAFGDEELYELEHDCRASEDEEVPLEYNDART
jgi:hypothetical protein